MAGIGQRNTFDHQSSWNSAAQLGMGRSMQNDTQKGFSTFQQASDKRSLLSNASGASTLGSLGGSFGLNYGPRPSSSTRLKGANATGGSMRNNYNQDSGVDSVALNFLPYGSGPNFPGTPQRGISEPSLLSGIGNINHSMNSDISLMSGLVNNSKSSFMGQNKSLAAIGLLGGSANTSNLVNASVSSPGLNFDPSDFPPIVNSVNQFQSQSYSSSSQNRNYVSAIAKGSGNSGNNPLSVGGSAVPNHSFSTSNVETSPEFSIDRDFPALPVAQSSAAISVNAVSGSNSTGAGAQASFTNPTALSVAIPLSSSSSHSLNAASGEALLKSQAGQRIQRSQSSSVSAAGASSGGSLQLLGDNYVTNIPRNMIDNQFGMIGLLKLIQIDPSFETLAPGLNLASLGIVNWPPPGELHSVFASPLTDQCMLRPQDMDYNVPPEYQIRSRVVGRLPADPPLEKLTDEILFWIFYNCCREEAQLVSAKELYNREWRYHKKKMRWLTRVPGSDVIREGTTEQGTYYCWEPLTWEKVVQQMNICYADLDETPTTYQLSSSTLNARVQPLSPVYQQQQSQPQQQQQQQQQHLFHGGGGAGGPAYFAQTGRIPRTSTASTASSTTTKLPVVSSMLPNGPSLGVPQQMSVAKLETKVNESALPLAVAATVASSSSCTSSADIITTTTTASTSSS